MLVELLILTACLTYFLVIVPMQRESVRIQEEDFRQRYYLFQLKQVRRNYPTLHGLSYSEIRSRYNVSESYRRL